MLWSLVQVLGLCCRGAECFLEMYFFCLMIRCELQVRCQLTLQQMLFGWKREMACGAKLISLSLLCCICFLESSGTFFMVVPAFKANDRDELAKKSPSKAHFVLDLRVVHVNKCSQLITIFLTFPAWTSAYLTSNLAHDIVQFLHILGIHMCFHTHLCKLSVLFSSASFYQVCF